MLYCIYDRKKLAYSTKPERNSSTLSTQGVVFTSCRNVGYSIREHGAACRN